MTHDAAGLLEEFQKLLPAWGDLLAVDCPDEDLSTLRQVGRAIGIHHAGRRAADVAGDGTLVARCRAGVPLPYPAGVFAGAWVTIRAENCKPAKLIQEVARVTGDHGAIALRIAGDAAETVAELTALGYEYRIAGRALLAARPGGPESAGGEADCLFCPGLRFRMNHVAGLPGAASVLCGDDQLFAVPDLAPVVPGHLLLVATTHRLAFAGAPPDLAAALGGAKARVDAVFERVYGSPAVFLEHGPVRPGHGSVCIDHAHLHCLPLRYAEGIAARVRAKAGAELGPDAAGPYLCVEERGAVSRLADTAGTSQFLRREVLDMLGETRPYRWQEQFAAPGSRRRFLDTLRSLVDHFDD